MLCKNEKGNLEIHSSDAGGDNDRYRDYPWCGELHVRLQELHYYIGYIFFTHTPYVELRITNYELPIYFCRFNI